MERTWSNAFLSDSSWDCSRGKSSRSVRISLSTALRSPGAASAGPGSASPVRTARLPLRLLFPQEASTHKTPNKILNAGQLVPKISGCRRRGLTATSTLCFCPRNWIVNSTTGYFTTSPCTHLTEPCSSYPMPRAELGFDGSRFGYILNPPKPNKYHP